MLLIFFVCDAHPLTASSSCFYGFFISNAVVSPNIFFSLIFYDPAFTSLSKKISSQAWNGGLQMSEDYSDLVFHGKVVFKRMFLVS